MTNIYRRVSDASALVPGDRIIHHNGKGWVFGIVDDVDLERREIGLRATSQHMIDPREARRQAVDLVAGILASEDVEIEDIDNPEDAWPTLDRTERRKLPALDPLASAIVKRLYPGGPWERDVWLTTRFETGGYSEYTMEQEYGLTIECGKYVVDIGFADPAVPLDFLLDWLDGEDRRAYITEKETA